jgi:hypothetical protein
VKTAKTQTRKVVQEIGQRSSIRDDQSVRAICIHDEEEQEPKPVARKPIVSIHGEDVKEVA